MTTFEATVGVSVSIPVWELAGGDEEIGDFNPGGVAPHPPGLTDDATLKRLVGTPTEVGEWEVRQHALNSYNQPIARGLPVTIRVVEPGDPEPGDPEPGDPEPGDPDPGDPDPGDPDPELPELDPFDLYAILARSLAPRVAAFVGSPGDADIIATAEAQVPVVTEYVRGYTRGRGFEDEAPSGPLRAVIVSGVARLATNPEQVSVFTTGDYSERPAQLAGWTLTELGVLRRYRRTSA